MSSERVIQRAKQTIDFGCERGDRSLLRNIHRSIIHLNSSLNHRLNNQAADLSSAPKENLFLSFIGLWIFFTITKHQTANTNRHFTRWWKTCKKTVGQSGVYSVDGGDCRWCLGEGSGGGVGEKGSVVLWRGLPRGYFFVFCELHQWKKCKLRTNRRTDRRAETPSWRLLKEIRVHI